MPSAKLYIATNSERSGSKKRPTGIGWENQDVSNILDEKRVSRGLVGATKSNYKRISKTATPLSALL